MYGMFKKNYDFSLYSNKVLKLVSTLIGIIEKKEFAKLVSEWILAGSDSDVESESVIDIVSRDESWTVMILGWKWPYRQQVWDAASI